MSRIDKVVVRPYVKSSGLNTKIEFYLTSPFSGFATFEEIRDMIAHADDFEIDLERIEKQKQEGKQFKIRERARDFCPSEIYLKLLLDAEIRDGKASRALLKRIIMAGGLIAYARQLEEKLTTVEAK